VSGHNRWSKIKRQKAAMGASKGTLFTKLIKEITVAARIGGGDPAGNARLRSAMLAAREANMPSENITRAVKKGTGELEGVHYEEVTYEGYGPGGVALLVECLTDNRHRTAGDVRAIFSKGGGHLAAEGAVAWNFHRVGSIVVKPGPSEDAVLEAALEAGADDVVPLGPDGFEVRTPPPVLHQVASALEKARLLVGEQRWVLLPQNTTRVESEVGRRVLTLVEALEDNDDVQNVWTNADFSEGELEQSAPA
jgi:YebC/PmpR family DNA-binding regulatory protein